MDTNRLTISNENLKPILSLYLLTLASGVLGFSLYLFLESLALVEIKVITWNGQGLIWGLITLFSSLFIGFLPIEFFRSFILKIESFKDLIATIIYSILVSLLFLLLFQFLIPNNSNVLAGVKNIITAVSFSGFIVVPIVLFLSNYFEQKLIFLEKFRFSIVHLFWILSIQLFL